MDRSTGDLSSVYIYKTVISRKSHFLSQIIFFLARNILSSVVFFYFLRIDRIHHHICSSRVSYNVPRGLGFTEHEMNSAILFLSLCFSLSFNRKICLYTYISLFV